MWDPISFGVLHKLPIHRGQIRCMPDLIDIIVPTYNPGSWFRSCMASVLRQSHRALRLIVVDDGSTPPIGERADTAKYLSDPRCILVRKEHGGVASARNLG